MIICEIFLLLHNNLRRFMGMDRILRISPLVRGNLSVAIKSIRSNGLRSLLTILIIAVGITSLVGILTATDALKREVFTSFEKFGTTSFSIVRKYFSTEGGARSRIRNNTTITYSQAMAFKKNYGEEQLVSIYAGVVSNVAVKYEGQSTNPTARVTAADENYLRYSNTSISKGRGITSNDIDLAAQVCVVGSGIVRTLFQGEGDALGKVISVQGYRYEIVGVTESQGSSFGGSADANVIIPVSTARFGLVGEKIGRAHV